MHTIATCGSPLTLGCRRLAAIAVVALLAGCSHRLPNGGEWARELAVRPGSSLPRDGGSQRQVITLFEVSQQRAVGKQFFIAGVGCVAFNGGGSTLAGFNRALDPFVELAVADRRDPGLAPGDVFGVQARASPLAAGRRLACEKTSSALGS